MPVVGVHAGQSRLGDKVWPMLLVWIVLPVATLLLHGYHPWSQDAAIYVPGIERQINHTLFAPDAPFVEGHTNLSIFSSLLAWVTRGLHLRLDWLLLICFLLSAGLFYYACHALAQRIFVRQAAVWGATLLAAVCFTMPVAATSLLLMDPYVTARGISSPASLLAVVACLDRAWKRVLFWCAVAVSVHPLMGAHLVAFVALLALLEINRPRIALALSFAGFILCAVLSYVTRNSPVTDAFREAVASRSYYYLSGWKWYECLGLVIPVALFALAAWKSGLRSKAGKLTLACSMIGGTTFLASLLFLHSAHPDFLMRLELLRSYHTLYAVGVVLLGGFVATVLTQRRMLWLGCLLLAGATAGMYFGDKESYPVSAQVEWPGSVPVSERVAAYLWIREHTPQGAVFAYDETDPAMGDDEEQGFRALTLRSVLVDTKDEGVVSVFPENAPLWQERRDVARGLNRMSDAERRERLVPHGVTWVLLPADAVTGFICPFRNHKVAVCELGGEAR